MMFKAKDTIMLPLLLFCFLLILTDAQENVTKPVRLTPKQGLLMNQVLTTYALDKPENPQCKNHTQRFKTGLRAFEPWALNMFDSSSKIQPGILLGNLVEFGSFKQCINIRSEEIAGKHCLIKITPTLQLIKKILSFRNVTDRRFPKIKLIVEKSVLLWSICLPASCPTSDIQRHFNEIITEMGNGLNLTVTIDENHCMTLESIPKLRLEQYIAISVLSFFPIVCLINTILEVVLPSRNNLITAFSVASNYRKIIARRTKNDLDCIHGLRFLSTCYVVIGHRYLMAMFSPVINGLEILDWILNYSSTIIIGGTICVDTFFMISGLLVSMSFFDYVTKNNSFNVITFYFYRYFRITPTLGIVVLLYATLIQFLGSGPLWYDTCTAHLTPCRQYWWSILLHIQSYVNPHSLCILQTWSLTCDMIFYYFSPFILYPLWKNQTFGIINWIVLYIVSILLSFYLAWINKYEGGMPITNQLFETKYFQRHYIAPHARASTYIIGLGFGYYLYYSKDKKIQISTGINITCWLVAASLMIASVVGCHVFQVENHNYNRLEASLFLSLSRSAWTFGLVWMVFACTKGYGGIINQFLSLFIFRLLGRIAYGIFLLHLILQLFKNGANKMPIYFSNFHAIYDSLADLFLMIFVSFLFTLFYELPLTNLESLFFKSTKVRPNN